jgi:hypothetical protein
MASETYEFLKKIAKGEEISRWHYPDDLISYVDYSSKTPKITITFDDDDDFLAIFDIDRDNPDRYTWARFVGGQYYNDDYDRYKYEDDWKEGYIIKDFNPINLEKLKRIVKLVNPTLEIEENESNVAKFLDKMFSNHIDNLIYDYGTTHSECIGRAVKEEILNDVKNPFYKFGIFELIPAYKFITDVRILLRLYKMLNAEDEDLKGLLKLLYEKYGNNNVGDWSELEYNSWCDDYDNEETQKNIGKALDDILETIEDDLMGENTNFDEYNKLYKKVISLGGFNKLIKIPEKNIEVIFETLDLKTNRLIIKLWKNNQQEKRSVNNLDDLNLILYHPELFESVRKILRKLL